MLDTPELAPSQGSIEQDRRWRRVSDTPRVGGTYLIGGYVTGIGLPRHFQEAFAWVILTYDGPMWRHVSPDKVYVPIEWWMDTGPHPESLES